MSKSLNSGDSSPLQLETRIKAVADLYDSRKSAANAAGVSTDMLARYMRGDSQPGFGVITNLCTGAGVNIGWVATGEGPMMASDLDGDSARYEDGVRAALGDEEAEQRRSEHAAQRLASIKELLPEVKERMSVAGVTLDDHWLMMLATWAATERFSLDNVQDIAAVIASSAATPDDQYAYITLYDAECSAGDGAWNEQCQALTKLAFTRYSLKRKGLDPEALSAIRVSGDSMEGDLSDGDAVLIDHSRTDIKGEGIYVIRLDGHLYAKRLQRTFDGVEIISTNKAYKTMSVPKDRLHELEVIGQVVWSASWRI
jgi:phage repressor protein C with HTH and peptisase S24 domain